MPLAMGKARRLAYEPPMTEEFWRSVGRGSLFLEYPLVIATSGSERRRVDGLIVSGGEFRKCSLTEAPDLTSRHVMVVQTIAGRTDAAHVGQALLSPWLLRQRFPEIGHVESILVTASPEPFLTRVLGQSGVREVTQAGPSVTIRRTGLTRVPRSVLQRLHRRLGGEMLLDVQLGGQPGQKPVLTADAVILKSSRLSGMVIGSGDLSKNPIAGSVATAVVSTSVRLGMYVAGFAIVARELLLAAGAAEASAIALVGVDDQAIQEALGHFYGVTARTISSLD